MMGGREEERKRGQKQRSSEQHKERKEAQRSTENTKTALRR
jgi:hypothetical protein